MRRLALAALALCLICFSCVAEEARVTAGGLSFQPPAGLEAVALDDEARREGVVYAAQSEDGALRMLVVCRSARRGEASISALLEALDESDGVSLGESVTVDGTAFALTTQSVDGSGEPPYFRAASAVRDGMRVVLFFIDTDGAHEDAPASAAKSVQWLDQPLD